MDNGQKNSPASHIRNVGIIAHIDAGKTTLTERILYAANEIRYMGEVHEGTTVTDWMPQERERGISITAAAVSCHWKQWLINIVDTPGHIDFTAEVERSLCVLDGVVAVFCAVRGVQAQSETVWRRAMRYKLPALAFVNKMDRLGAEPEQVVKQMVERLGMPALPVQFPIGTGDGWLGTLDLLSGTWNGPAKEPDLEPYSIDIEIAFDNIVEKLSDYDDEVLKCYLEGTRPSAEQLRRALRKAVIRRKIVPVFFGSSLHNVGVKRLMDAIGLYLPSPVERKSNAETNGASALVFRVAKGLDGLLAYSRIQSGIVHKGTVLKIARNGAICEVSEVLKVRAADVTPVAEAGEGEIVALTGNWQHLRTGDILLPPDAEAKPVRLQFPQPVVSLLIEAVGAKAAEMASALKLMAREDPTLRVKQETSTASWMISGMGELHLEIIRDRLKMDYGIPTRAGKPRVEYLATIKQMAQGRGTFEKHLYDGKQLNAEVTLQMEPLERGSGMKMDFSKLEAVLPQESIQAIRHGVASIVNGDSFDCPLTDVMVTMLSASSDAGEAREVSLLNAARMAMNDALNKANRVVLEPIMLLEINTPSDTSGNVIADLAARKARISSVESVAENFTRIVAHVPLAELFGYASSLRSLSAGRGEVVAEPAEYAPRATL